MTSATLPDRGRLTKRQAEIFDYLIAYVEKHGSQPSMREIGRDFGMNSPNGVFTHLKALVAKGFLAHDGFEAKAYRFVGWKFQRVRDVPAPVANPAVTVPSPLPAPLVG